VAEKCREETESKVPDGILPAGPSRYRACLIVSMIVLVWNVGASGRHFYYERQTETVHAGENGMFPGAVSDPSPPVDCTASVPTGPLNVKQRFLLGRKVDINRAGWVEISGLPGISDKVAESIVETRGRIGRFRRPEELMMAKGIKEKKLKKILPFISGFDNN